MFSCDESGMAEPVVENINKGRIHLQPQLYQTAVKATTYSKLFLQASSVFQDALLLSCHETIIDRIKLKKKLYYRGWQTLKSDCTKKIKDSESPGLKLSNAHRTRIKKKKKSNAPWCTLNINPLRKYIKKN